MVDGRVVFGDKMGWIYMLSAKDGKRLAELKIGENINATRRSWVGTSIWGIQRKTPGAGNETKWLGGSWNSE